MQTLIDYLPTEITSYEEVSAVVDATRQYEELSEAQKALLTEGTDENLAQVQNLAAVYNRQCNGVTIEGDFPWYVQFLVEMKNEETDSSVLVPEKADTFITPYNMKLWDLMKDEEYVLSGQQVKITMPAPDGQIYDKLVIIHYREDGSVEYITPINNPDETISFVTTSFSPYNVAGSRIAGSDSLVGNIDKVYDKPNKPNKKPLVPKNPSGNKKPSNSKKPGYKPSGDSTNNWVPKTGDDQNMLLYAGIAGGALVILAVAFVMKNRKKNSDKTEE